MKRIIYIQLLMNRFVARISVLDCECSHHINAEITLFSAYTSVECWFVLMNNSVYIKQIGRGTIQSSNVRWMAISLLIQVTSYFIIKVSYHPFKSSTQKSSLIRQKLVVWKFYEMPIPSWSKKIDELFVLHNSEYTGTISCSTPSSLDMNKHQKMTFNKESCSDVMVRCLLHLS